MPDQARPPQEESRFHRYVGNTIPWYVHVGWVLFWIFAITYSLTYVFPSLRVELLMPP